MRLCLAISTTGLPALSRFVTAMMLPSQQTMDLVAGCGNCCRAIGGTTGPGSAAPITAFVHAPATLWVPL